MQNSNHRKPLITIIGGGPIGLEAALYARQLGYPLRLLEKGLPADNLRRWGHVTLFSPFEINHTPLGRKVAEAAGVALPAGDEYLTGGDYRKRYLQALADSPLLREVLVPNCEVLAVSRRGMLKGDGGGDKGRGNTPFRILARTGDGAETVFYSDVVIDASGSYGYHNWLGDGGIPAAGELSLQERIEYELPDIAGAAKERYAGKRVLLVGDGYSAATSMISLGGLIEEYPTTSVTWLTRPDCRKPLLLHENDPLPERDRVARLANALVDHPEVNWLKNAAVEALFLNGRENVFRVTVRVGGQTRMVDADEIIANVGYSPDCRIYRELQVHECFASLGPMKLAAALAGEKSADCMAQTGKGPEVLKNPEPNFYIIGMKSYGRNSHFLLRIGFEQIRDVFKLITGDDALDLYAGEVEAAGEKTAARTPAAVPQLK